MDISNEMVDKLSDLAKLEFTTEEKERLKNDLSRITGFFEKLNELDTDNVEPLIFMTDEVNVLRNDEVAFRVTERIGKPRVKHKEPDSGNEAEIHGHYKFEGFLQFFQSCRFFVNGYWPQVSGFALQSDNTDNCSWLTMPLLAASSISAW